MNERCVGPALDIEDQVIPVVGGRLRTLHRRSVRVVSCRDERRGEESLGRACA